ncbi:MAG: hypothetical protein JST93_16280 [Acidobacteria bacterium]|nr:hypothetical protein [Acidobacteriota bacterium]
MQSQPSHPQINISNFGVGANAGGVIIATGIILIALIGIPVTRYLLPLAVILGLAIALILHFIKPKPPLAVFKPETPSPSE